MKCNCGLREAADKFPKQVTHAAAVDLAATLNYPVWGIPFDFLPGAASGYPAGSSDPDPVVSRYPIKVVTGGFSFIRVWLDDISSRHPGRKALVLSRPVDLCRICLPSVGAGFRRGRWRN